MSRWTATQNITGGLANPLGTVMTNGRTVYQFWIDGAANLKFAKSVDEGQSYTAAVTIAAGVSDVQLDRPCAVNGNTIHLLVSQNVDVGGSPCTLGYLKSTNAGATWSGITTLDNGAGHANNTFIRSGIAVNGNTVHIVYTIESNTTFTTDGLFYFKSTDAGASWAARVQLFAADAVSPVRPDIAVVGNLVHVTWTDQRLGKAGNGGETWYGRSPDAGATWTQTQISNTATHATLRAAIVADGANLCMFWQDPGGGAIAQLYRTISADAGLSWSAIAAVTAAGANQTHCYLAMQGMTVYVAWEDHTPATCATRYMASTDGGSTFGASVIVATNANGTNSAPRMFLSTHMLILDFADAPNGTFQSRNPVYLTPPDDTRVLDNCVHPDGGPPPTASWAGGNNLNTTGGEGLVVLTNRITRAAAGGFRQGSRWVTPFGGNQEVWYTVSNIPTANGDGIDIYMRGVNMGSAGINGYDLWTNFDGVSVWSWIWHRIDAGVGVSLQPLGTVTRALVAGDKVGTQAIDDNLYVWVKATGDAEWLLLMNAVDGTYTAAGQIGMDITLGQNSRISAFGGGELASGSSAIEGPPGGSSAWARGLYFEPSL